MAIRIVSPYRPFAPESRSHLELGVFDWVGALEMLQSSVHRVMPTCEAVAITDVDTRLPVASLAFQTTERRLMLWILEVSLRYLESDSFDRDTVMLSPDTLVLKDLSYWFDDVFDLAILVRLEDKFQDGGGQVLNQVQFWRYVAKAGLIRFYRRALEIAHTLSEEWITWGADTEPIRQLIEPIQGGIYKRQDLFVSMICASSVLESLTSTQMKRMEAGAPLITSRAVLDFRSSRKRSMRMAYEALSGVPA